MTPITIRIFSEWPLKGLTGGVKTTLSLIKKQQGKKMTFMLLTLTASCGIYLAGNINTISGTKGRVSRT
ncbi:hypothetical protein HA49_15220 [Tatumella morbirosei]|uniref:Uncharacterized protein n=1 Tax=Tatumella morbirosei TaxID=642227 RepID=A0A095T6H9_9GAMM|nr:hypothetical protein HA49_15220 [Tatumella morbirosei]